jgi:hypothetical protein
MASRSCGAGRNIRQERGSSQIGLGLCAWSARVQAAAQQRDRARSARAKAAAQQRGPTLTSADGKIAVPALQTTERPRHSRPTARASGAGRRRGQAPPGRPPGQAPPGRHPWAGTTGRHRAANRRTVIAAPTAGLSSRRESACDWLCDLGVVPATLKSHSHASAG